MSTDLSSTVTTTTEDRPDGRTVTLRAVRSPDGWTVQDCATTRFGAGLSLRQALMDYCLDLEALTWLEEPLGPPVAAEAKYARKVFGDV